MGLVATLAAIACGPSAPICDEDRVRLPQPAGYQLAGLVGDTSIVTTRVWRGTDDEPEVSVLSDACGRDAVELETLVVLVGETPYARERASNGPGTLHWIDMGPQPKVAHAVIEAGFEHVHEVGGGVVSKTWEGLVFRNDPSDPNGASTVLLDPFAPTDDIEDSCGDDCLSISDGPLQGQVARDGDDGVLVAAPGGPIYRFSLPSAEREVIVEEPAEVFRVLEDPNYLLWSARGGDDGVWVRNRQTAEDRWLDDGALFSRSHQVVFPWVAGVRWLGTDPTTALLDVETGDEHVLQGSWKLSADLPDGRLLLHEASTYAPSILDPATGALEEIDFPVHWSSVKVVGGSIIARSAPRIDVDAVELIRFDLSTGETSAFDSFQASSRGWQPQYLWTNTGDLLFWDTDQLVRRRLDEPREILASGGSSLWLREENGVEHVYYDSPSGDLFRVALD